MYSPVRQYVSTCTSVSLSELNTSRFFSFLFQSLFSWFLYLKDSIEKPPDFNSAVFGSLTNDGGAKGITEGSGSRFLGKGGFRSSQKSSSGGSMKLLAQELAAPAP